MNDVGLGNGAWWRLPGPARFVARVERSVIAGPGGLTIIRTATGPPEGLVGAISERIRENAFFAMTSFEAAEDETRPPAHELARACGRSTGMIRSVADLTASEALRDMVFLISKVSLERWASWSMFFRAFRSERGRRARPDAPRLLCFVSAAIPEAELAPFGDAVIPFLGAASRLDMELFLHETLGAPEEDLVARTAFATLVEVAAWDRRTALLLAQQPMTVRLAPAPFLKDMAKTLETRRPSWSNGLVEFWEGQPCLHPVAAALDDGVALERRIWLGQSRVLLPFIDVVRRRVVNRYKDVFSQKLTHNPASHGYDRPDDLELWDLAAMLEGCADVSLIHFLRSLNGLRNSIAHLKPCHPSFVVRLGEAWRAVSNMIPDAYAHDGPLNGAALTEKPTWMKK